MIEATVEELTPIIGTRPACRAVGASPATIYRRRRPPERKPPRPRPTPARALSDPERETVLEVLHCERFVDVSPEEAWATLLDEGTYLCSTRTMYRILAAQHGGVRERRNQLTHPPTRSPSCSPSVRTSCGRGHLEAEGQQPITPRILHADRGAPMRSKHLSELLDDLGVSKTHSRPYTSSDNPYSESNFKTLKYRPAFPARFDSIEHAREHCRAFVGWYNHQHRHSGIGLMTPAAIHHGQAPALHAARARVLDAAYARNPERFVRKPPAPPSLPTSAWINKPTEVAATH